MQVSQAFSSDGLPALVSFRDPCGRTFVGADRVIREVQPSGWPTLQAFLKTALCEELVGNGALVSTKTLSEGERFSVVEHEKIPFPSYAFEWAPEMLEAAGHLTLDLTERSLEYGFGLKDASPSNVLFLGPRPVFIDVLSFERRLPGDPLWLPYGQFVRTFLLPLLMDRRLDVSLQSTFLANRDGLEPETIYHASGLTRRFRSPFFSLSTLPTWLGRTKKGKSVETCKQRTVSDDRAQFALGRLYRTARKQLQQSAKGQSRETRWTPYEHECPYASHQIVEKRTFVESVLKKYRFRRVLDVGCNSGTFSRLASQLGSDVVAIDSDRAVIGRLWEKARSEKLSILPLVIDIARPSPAAGWRNLENESFLDRSRGYFNCILLLGILHHLLVTERIPLDSILELAADLTTHSAVVEYIGRDDPMFQALLRGRDHLHHDFTPLRFEEACEKRFRVIEKMGIPDSSRVVYLLRKKNA
jgi:SAM-dependent methyltransferase